MRLGLGLIAAVAGAAGMGCGLSQEGISPPANQIFYPGAIKIDPSTDAGNQPNHWLYVDNSNADLRFNDGTLVVVDLVAAAADHDRDPDHSVWGSCPTVAYIRPSTATPTQYCCWDLLDSNVLDCDERAYTNVSGQSAVKLGSFGSAIVAQTSFSDPSVPTVESTRRLLVAVRGNSSITTVRTTVTPDGVGLCCTSPAVTDTGDCPSAFDECDTQHMVTVVQPTPVNQIPAGLTAPPLLPPEPYALALDPTLVADSVYAPALTQQLLYVGHLTGGFLSLIDVTANPPQLIDVMGNLFPPDPNGSEGVSSLTIRRPGLNGAIYATSRFLPRAGSFAATNLDSPPSPTEPDLDLLGGTGDTLVSSLPGSEARGIQFIEGEQRAFLLQRNPPALVGFDTSVPGINTPIDVIELCDSPTFLNMPTFPGSDRPLRLFVTCFNSGEVYVIDPYVPRTVAIIEVGRGPAGLDFATPVAPDPTVDPADDHAYIDSFRAYVNGFGSNNVSVIDLQPGSPTENHVIQRIGFPSPVPR